MVEREFRALEEWWRMCVNGDGILAFVTEDALRAVYRVPAGSEKYMSGARDEAAQCAIRNLVKKKWKM